MAVVEEVLGGFCEQGRRGQHTEVLPRAADGLEQPLVLIIMIGITFGGMPYRQLKG